MSFSLRRQVSRSIRGSAGHGSVRSIPAFALLGLCVLNQPTFAQQETQNGSSSQTLRTNDSDGKGDDLIGQNSAEKTPFESLDRSPVDIAISDDEKYIATANQSSNSVTLIRVADRTVVDEIACGHHPVDIQFVGKRRILLTAKWSGELNLFRIENGRLSQESVIPLGGHPHGITVSQDENTAYVGLAASEEVAEIDLVTGTSKRRFSVGRWPKYLTLSPDGKRLAVGNGGDSNIAIVDTNDGEILYEEPLANGTNLGQMRASSDGKYAYFTWMVYRTNPINIGNIRRGWVLASRIGRVSFEGPSYREAISLDVPGKAVSDPHDLEISQDQQTLVATGSGTHELLVYRLPDLPFIAQGGPGDLIERSLKNNPDRFYRIDLGGRPLGVRISKDNRTVFVANHLRNSVQLVDLSTRTVAHEINLGGPAKTTLARRGMEIFYDGTRSLDQWYSCHSCHQDGGTNSRPMDTMNDGSEMTLKTVLSLYNVTKTYPWTWHGWQTDLMDSMEKSITSTMQGEQPTEEDKRALVAYLGTLRPPPNPFINRDGTLTTSAQRGKKVFYSRKAACIDCHNGPYFSDGKIHDVGSGSDEDVYRGYNTPTLVGVFEKVRLLHTGRAKDLNRVITDLHRPDQVNGEGELTEQEVADLIAYLKSL